MNCVTQIVLCNQKSSSLTLPAFNAAAGTSAGVVLSTGSLWTWSQMGAVVRQTFSMISPITKALRMSICPLIFQGFWSRKHLTLASEDRIKRNRISSISSKSSSGMNCQDRKIAFRMAILFCGLLELSRRRRVRIGVGWEVSIGSRRYSKLSHPKRQCGGRGRIGHFQYRRMKP